MAPPARDVRATVVEWRALAREAAERSPSMLVVASYTANPLEPHLGVALHAATGDVAEITFGDYNQVFQICLDPGAHGADRADDIVVLWRIEDVFERDFHAWSEGDPAAGGRLIDGARALGAAVGGLAAAVDGSVIAADAPTPVGFGLDHADPEVLTELLELARAAEAAFVDGLGDAPVERLRVAALQHALGTEGSFDRRTWLMARQPHSDEFTRRLGGAIADVIAARTRTPPKVIVLDADDTLWAGIIADDGIGALQCSDAFPGFAHRSFQFALRRLRHRGVLLAVASKNDPESVAEAFASVDGMVLGDDDISARRVTWDPKPPGVADMARELNLGLDSFVFVDDSDYEIGAMRTQLPDVRSLQVPERLEELPDLLAETGWFRLMRVTDDDRERTARMQAESGRTAAATAMSHEEFLASLDLRVHLVRVGAAELGRATQLINKTNQFNVTTIRRSEQEVRELADNADAGVYAASVEDRFGEYGIVGVVIARRSDGSSDSGWDLDTVLMSCRVLGRGVESAILAGVVDDLRSERPGPIRARYVDSGRNHLVEDLFPRHGFEPDAASDSDGGAADEGAAVGYVLAAETGVAVPGHITLTRP